MQRDIQECVSLFCSFFSSSILSGNDGLTIGDAAGKKKKRELTENLLGGDCLWIKIYNIFWKLPDETKEHSTHFLLPAQICSVLKE